MKIGKIGEGRLVLFPKGLPEHYVSTIIDGDTHIYKKGEEPWVFNQRLSQVLCDDRRHGIHPKCSDRCPTITDCNARVRWYIHRRLIEDIREALVDDRMGK